VVKAIVEEKLAWLLNFNLLPSCIIIGRNVYQEFIRDNKDYGVEDNTVVYKSIPVMISCEQPDAIIVAL